MAWSGVNYFETDIIVTFVAVRNEQGRRNGSLQRALQVTPIALALSLALQRQLFLFGISIATFTSPGLALVALASSFGITTFIAPELALVLHCLFLLPWL